MRIPDGPTAINRAHGRLDSCLLPGDHTPIAPIAYLGNANGGTGKPAVAQPPPPPVRTLRTVRGAPNGRAQAAIGRVDERRHLARDLHDGVQNDLVGLIVNLALAQQDAQTPPPLAATLAALEARAQAVLDAVRDIARGIDPPLLADFGLARALRAQAARAAIRVSLLGTAPRSTPENEHAVYFCCLEAIQNAAKHAGPTAQLTLRLHHHDRTLTAQIADNGRGFDPTHTPAGAGLASIHERIHHLGGAFDLASEHGCGTVLTISLHWPARPV